jgi:hypothetical protein
MKKDGLGMGEAVCHLLGPGRFQCSPQFRDRGNDMRTELGFALFPIMDINMVNGGVCSGEWISIYRQKEFKNMLRYQLGNPKEYFDIPESIFNMTNGDIGICNL